MDCGCCCVFIPAVRAVSFAARAAYYATGNIQLMAVTRAMQVCQGVAACDWQGSVCQQLAHDAQLHVTFVWCMLSKARMQRCNMTQGGCHMI
jgi:hypothetical protein